jgi:hypothetical protein
MWKGNRYTRKTENLLLYHFFFLSYVTSDHCLLCCLYRHTTHFPWRRYYRSTDCSRTRTSRLPSMCLPLNYLKLFCRFSTDGTCQRPGTTQPGGDIGNYLMADCRKKRADYSIEPCVVSTNVLHYWRYAYLFMWNVRVPMNYKNILNKTVQFWLHNVK